MIGAPGRRRRGHGRGLRLLAVSIACAPLGGCPFANLMGGMLQNAEYQKKIQVLPQYEGLEGHSVAVLVDTDMSVLYEHPRLVEQITTGLTLRIGRDVPDVRVVHPKQVLAWQWRTPQWNAMPYGDLAESLDVDRVLLIDLYEYRLNPPGNRWLWEGVCAANINVIERDSPDPDAFYDTFHVISEFPTIKGVDRSSASAGQVETGLLAQFIQHSAWLFHEHVEPKHPDKYRPELERE